MSGKIPKYCIEYDILIEDLNDSLEAFIEQIKLKNKMYEDNYLHYKISYDKSKTPLFITVKLLSTYFNRGQWEIVKLFSMHIKKWIRVRMP